MDNIGMYTTAKGNIDVLDVEAKCHGKINTDLDMPADDQKEGNFKATCS
jgi:hypothetical protein